MIEGEPGSGKTTLVEHWIERWQAGLDGEPKDGMLLPILVRFRSLPSDGMTESDSRLAEMIWEQAERGKFKLRVPHLYDERRKARFVPIWLMDGWDEAPSAQYRSLEFLDRLLGLPGLKLLTCRTEVLAGIRTSLNLSGHIDGNRIYTLRDFDPREQQLFLSKKLEAFSKEVAELHASLQKHSQMRVNSTRPLLLGLIAEMAEVNFGRGVSLKFPGNRASFYAQASEHMWRTKLAGRNVPRRDPHLRDQLLVILAGYMELNKLRISSKEVWDLLDSENAKNGLADFEVAD